ncbi:MAG: response regulator [Bacteroidia bacterium]|nr:response regulator [Bacteroidia bacterium]
MNNKLYNILLVDDDQVDVMNVQRAFKKNNIQNPLHVANNGMDAFDLLRGTEGRQKIIPTPRLILLDINMPRMNGIEFLRELRKDPVLRFISVIIMTTSNDDKDKFEAYNLNVAGYIVKPVSFEKFVNAVSVLNTYWQLCEMP